MRYTTLHTLPLLAGTSVLAQPFESPQNTSSIQWTNCTTTLPGACGTLAVPLDYTNTSSGRTLNLSLFKLDAKFKPSKGSILVNQGGPGGDGVEFVQGAGALIQIMTGGHYDIIGFDPRGTGKTLTFNCIPDPKERQRATMFGSQLVNSSDTALGTAWAYASLMADNCYQNGREIGELMGTGFVVRDMMQIVDALGGDRKLRFWGQSYGTYLGATAAAMFPDRIERMVIDGVVNLEDYTEGWEYDNLPVGEVTLKKFLEACIDTKDQTACALYRPNATVEGLTSRIYNLIDEVRSEPIVMGSNITTDVVDYNQLKLTLDNALRILILYAPALAGYLDSVLERNKTAYQIYQPIAVPPELPGSASDALLSIRCSDSTFRTDKLKDIVPRVEKMADASRLFGDLYPTSYMFCSRWKMQAKGRYEGNFKTKTKNPMLIIGSPYDIRTPFVSAQKVHNLFEGSALLQHNGYGHCVLFSPGQCAIKAVQDYFTNGTLPKPGTVCEQDFGMFSGKNIQDSFALAAPTS